MAKKINSSNLPKVQNLGIENITEQILNDLKIMSKDSFFKNELFDEYHSDFLNKYSTEVPEYIILYVVERLEQYWKILNPKK